MVIVPDVHGRAFHEEIFNNLEDKIIFLGDYEDPYDTIDICVLLERMEKIFEFAKNNPDRVILLLGNHSMYYYFKIQGWARYDYINANQIESLYDKYRDLFKIVYWDEETQTMFSHAGISKGWLEDWGLYTEEESPQNTVDLLNSLIDAKSFNCLNCIDRFRGGYDNYASPLWADVREFYGKGDMLFPHQIFGHTQLNEDGSTLQQNNWIMCDSRCLFEWDGELFKKYLE